MRILHVSGARPNFVKIASIVKACNQNGSIQSILVHTGQHYSYNMSEAFFDDLGIPQPDVNLEVGSGSHAHQTAEIMRRFEPVLLKYRPDAVLVVGDVNSTIACALVAAKMAVKVIHVEAGLRSFDRTMPEEINRVLVDAISNILFVSEPSGLDNLRREGVDASKVHFVGNVMIDTLDLSRQKAAASLILQHLDLQPRQYVVVTLHRPSNVDQPHALEGILAALGEIQKEFKVIFPVHPRTLRQLESAAPLGKCVAMPNLQIVEPLGYLDFLKLMSESRLVITDSGGIQEETTILGIPCLTVRENTERPITITEGTNTLVGADTARILAGYRDSLNKESSPVRPKFWDGKASERIVRVLLGKMI